MSDHNDRVMEPFHTEPSDNRPVDGKGYRGDAAVPNPGVPQHLPRPTDVDPAQARRTELQVAGMFVLATLLTLGFCVAYYVVPEDAVIGTWRAHNLVLGATLGLALLLIGIGAIQWAKKLMDDHEVVELRHPTASSKEDRETALAALDSGAQESGIGRRPLIRNSLLASLAVLGLPAIVSLTDLGPVGATGRLTETVWRRGMRVVNDVSGLPIRPADIELGQLVNGQPLVLVPTGDEAADEENGVLHGHELLQEKAKASVIIVRMRPEDVQAPAGKENWGIDGILCYSKICTHVGCPISLYEQQTHLVLCPCHQSTFDLAEGARVTFGPAARPLPQLPLGLDDEGYLIALDGFDDIAGPSYPTMPRNDT